MLSKDEKMVVGSTYMNMYRAHSIYTYQYSTIEYIGDSLSELLITAIWEHRVSKNTLPVTI